MGVLMEGCSVKCVTVVEGGVGDAITPVNTRKTDDIIWDEEDRRVGRATSVDLQLEFKHFSKIN